MKEIDIDTWKRKDHFRFFTQFDEPFYGLVAYVDCTLAYQVCKERSYSFYLFYLHKALCAINSIPEFKTRIIDGKPYLLDQINASPTVLRPDKTFGFSYMVFDWNFEEFQNKAKIEISRVEETSGLDLSINGQDVVHCSAVPWIDFTSLSHARPYKFADSCTKISFGKMVLDGSRRKMSVSIHAHHALADGYHVGLFYEYLQKFMDDAELSEIDPNQ